MIVAEFMFPQTSLFYISVPPKCVISLYYFF
jgi:hypothetical protein